jgi:peptidyl-prolyl cis-trans isomerase B (cyclophilin B)
MYKLIHIVALVLFAFCVSGFGQDDAKEVGVKTDQPKTEKKANRRPADPPRKSEPLDTADVKTMASKCVKLDTDKGVIEFELFPESAPVTTRNFLNLVAIKALDNTTFSRVVPDFVIQGGDLYTNENISNDMKWRAVRTIPDEPNLIKHMPGIVSMARGDEPNTASSAFFILVTDHEGLDGKFAAFGRVTNGMDVVRTINKMPVTGETPKKPVRIKKAMVETCQPANVNQETAN